MPFQMQYSEEHRTAEFYVGIVMQFLDPLNELYVDIVI